MFSERQEVLKDNQEHVKNGDIHSSMESEVDDDELENSDEEWERQQ